MAGACLGKYLKTPKQVLNPNKVAPTQISDSKIGLVTKKGAPSVQPRTI